jgi:hypothetical protein
MYISATGQQIFTYHVSVFLKAAKPMRAELITKRTLQSDDKSEGCCAPLASRVAFLSCITVADWNSVISRPVKHEEKQSLKNMHCNIL